MRAALALLAAVVSSACGGGSYTSDDIELPFTTVARSNDSGVTTGEGVVARSQAEFDAVWSRYAANQSPPPRPPVIDFGTTQVLGYFLGTRPNGCYSMAITRVSQTADRLVVRYREETPVAGAVCTQAVVNPAHLVAVAKSGLQVQFVAE